MKQVNFTDHSHLFKAIPEDKYEQLTKAEVVQLHKSDQDLIKQMQKALDEAYAKITEGEQKSFLLEQQTLLIES